MPFGQSTEQTLILWPNDTLNFKNKYAFDSHLGHHRPAHFCRALHDRAGSAPLSSRLFLDVRSNATRGRAILAVCAKDTSPNEIARAVPAQACLARLLKAQDLNPDEEVCKADFRRRVLYCFVAFGLTLIAQFKPDSPAVLMPLSQALLLCAIGMIIGAVARYRILRTMDVAEATLKDKGLWKEPEA